MSILTFRSGARQVHANVRTAIDLSIPVTFGTTQVNAFGAPLAQAHALRAGAFIGDVRQGGSCNCATLTFTPHCNGTHTESVAHLTGESHCVATLAQGLYLARMITLAPQGEISLSLLQPAAGDLQDISALIIRTLPNSLANSPAKTTQHHDGATIPAWFAADALAWLASQDIEHLLVDLPSVDHIHDPLLLAHRAFWGLPAGNTCLADARRPDATITELIHIPDAVIDGDYLLNLQIASLAGDAAPSRPLLYPLITTTP